MSRRVQGPGSTNLRAALERITQRLVPTAADGADGVLTSESKHVSLMFSSEHFFNVFSSLDQVVVKDSDMYQNSGCLNSRVRSVCIIYFRFLYFLCYS